MAEVQGDQAQTSAEEEDRDDVAVPRTGDLVIDTVTTIARALVEHPDDVHVESVPSDRGPRYRLTVNPEDIGRVIGRGGRMANAIRHLARAAAARAGIHIVLEIGE